MTLKCKVTLFLRQSTGIYYANLFWPDTKNRKRISLQTNNISEAQDAINRLQSKFLDKITQEVNATPKPTTTDAIGLKKQKIRNEYGDPLALHLKYLTPC